jgi:putative flippase GtrA
VGLGIRIPLFAFLEPHMINFYGALNLPIPLSFQFLGYNTSLAIAVLVVLLWNFFANRFWTYSDVSTT